MKSVHARDLMLPALRQIADNLGYPYIEPTYSDDFCEKFMTNQMGDIKSKYREYLKEINAKKLVL